MDDDQEYDMQQASVDIAADMGFNGDDHNDNDDHDSFSDEDAAGNDEINENELDTDVPNIKSPPSSWAKDHHEDWSKIPETTQEYIELREKQMLDGIEQYKQGYALANELRAAIEPNNDILTNYGIDAKTAIGNMFNHHRALTTGSIEARTEALVNLGRGLGLIPGDGQEAVNYETLDLQQRLARMENQERARLDGLKSQQLNAITSDVNAFFEDPANIYANELADDIVLLLKTGIDLKAAYEKALWSNPITREKEQQKIIDARVKANSDQQKIAQEKARKIGNVNVNRTQSTRSNSQPLGSWDDTMDEIITRINNS